MFVPVSAWKNSVNAVIGDVGILIGHPVLKLLNIIKKMQLKMMIATFNGKPSKTIISCYSLTNASDETDFDTCYYELSSIWTTNSA